MAKNSKQQIVKAETHAVGPALDFSHDAGMGMEGADRDSFAIPFLVVLQSNSPQLDTVDGAKPGMLYNSVTGNLMDSATVIPVAFQRKFLAWAPRSAGGGFRGEHAVAVVEAPDNPLNWTRDDEGHMTLPDDSILKDTRNHFVLILGEDGSAQQALLSLSSTQIKKSKRWMSMQQAIQLKRADGTTFTPPSFSHMYHVGTVVEENDKGKWRGIDIKLTGPVADPEIYRAAKAFHAMIVAGKVNVSPPVEEAAGGEAF